MSRDTVLWTCLLAPPVVWFLAMETNFVLTPWACAFGFGWKLAMIIVSVVGLVITALLMLTAYGQWRSLGREFPDDAGGAIPRARTMAILGGLTAAFAFLVILAQAIPVIMMGACQ
jgi:hypothetical protein